MYTACLTFEPKLDIGSSNEINFYYKTFTNKINHSYFILIRKCKQWWSTIPSISIKRTVTSYINSLTWKIQPRHITLEIQNLAWDRHNNVTGLDQSMGAHLLPPLVVKYLFGFIFSKEEFNKFCYHIVNTFHDNITHCVFYIVFTIHIYNI